MATFVKGDIVIVPFPFSDLSQAKRRPALVIANLKGDDVILCQITSQAKSDNYAVAIIDNDFISGSLNKTSNIRPNRIFTADSGIILYRAGKLNTEKVMEVVERIINILQ